jgi:hypothetical protein
VGPKTIIVPVVLYGCEIWLLTAGEEHRLRVFENRVLRKIFWPERDEVTGNWGKLHNEELHEILGWWAGMGDVTNAYVILFGDLEEKTPLRRLGRRWEDNIKVDLKEIGWKRVYWTHSVPARDCWRALVNRVMNLRFP